MEEAYQRMEESNRRIQQQYSNLLEQYQALSKTLSQPGVKASLSPSGDRPGATGPARSGADVGPALPSIAALLGLDEEPDEFPPRIAFGQQPGGAEGEMGRIDRSGQPSGPQLPQPLPFEPRSDGPSGVGAQGGIGRGTGAGTTAGAGPTVGPGFDFDRPGGMSRMDRIGVGAEGTGGRVSPTQQPSRAAAAAAEAEVWVYKPDAGPPVHRAVVRFGEGLEFRTEDDEYTLQFHNLTQVDYRGFPTQNQGVLQSQFIIPRERWYFTGNLTKNVGYYTVINRGYGSLDVLDAFISLRLDDRLRLRVGRMKTPYLYEYFSIAEGDLVAPERSIFADNLALNRQIGMLVLGNLFDDHLSYATGIYNGPRNSFQAYDSSKNWIGTITTRPLLTTQALPALRYLNLGGSWDIGYQANTPTQPTYFETANDQTSGTGAQSVSPTFLGLNKNVIEQGERVQWGAHAVWFYRSLFLMAEYGGGRAGYAFSGSKYSTPVNYSGWFVQASYFITGEELTRRVSVAQASGRLQLQLVQRGPVPSRRRRASGPVQHDAAWSEHLHGWIRRPDALDQPRLGDRHRAQLVPELLHQAPARLAAFRLRQPGHAGARQVCLDRRPLLAEVSALLLIPPRLRKPARRSGEAQQARRSTPALRSAEAHAHHCTYPMNLLFT